MRNVILTCAWLLALAPAVQATVFTNIGTIQTDTLTLSGTYDIIAVGGTGGAGIDSGTGSSIVGGAGAMASGQIYLTAGTVLDIIVGGTGGTGNFGSLHGGGGGGGSFVFLNNSTALVIAGGGGGAGVSADTGVNASITTSGSGGDGINGGAGGTSGFGGRAGAAGLDDGGGGAGYFGAGGSDMADPIGSGQGGAGAPSFAGGPGDVTDDANSLNNGGFGGGGGGGYSGGGGGGGYSGGGGGDGSIAAGGGGGSLVAANLSTGAIFQNVMITAGANTSGDGLTRIELVPEPASLALLAGVLAMVTVARRRGNRNEARPDRM